MLLYILSFLILNTATTALLWSTRNTAGSIGSIAGHAGVGNATGFYIFGGYTGSSLALAQNKLFYYNYIRNSVTAFLSGTSPTARASFSFTPDLDGTIAVLYGGVIYSSTSTAMTFSNECWILDLARAAWTKANYPTQGIVPPPSVAFHAAAYDHFLGTFFIQGGLSSEIGPPTGSLRRLKIDKNPDGYDYALFPETDTSPTATRALFGHSLVYHRDLINAESMLILYGGASGIQAPNPTISNPAPAFVRICATLTVPSKSLTNCSWTSFTGESLGTSRFGHRAVMNPVTNEMVVSGGYTSTLGNASPVKSVVIFHISSSDPRHWSFRTVTPGGSEEIGIAVAWHAMFTFKVSPDVTAIVRHGGLLNPARFPFWPQSSTNVGANAQNNDFDFSMFYTGSAPTVPSYVVPAVQSSQVDAPVTTSMVNVNADALELETMSTGSIAGISVLLGVVFIGSVVYYIRDNPELLKFATKDPQK